MTTTELAPIPCPECERAFSSNAAMKRHRTRAHDPEPDADRVAAAVAAMGGDSSPEPPAGDNGGPVESAGGGGGEAAAETRPQARPAPEKQKGIFEKFRKQPPRDGGPAEPNGEQRPRKPTPRRVSTQDFWGDAVEGGAGIIAKTGYVPMSRAMVWSSPVAGEIIEEATKGTIVDKGIQPLVRGAEKWSELFDLIGFWAAIGMAQAQPEKAGMALVFARKRLVNLLPKIAKNIAAQKRKERAAAQALADVMPELRDDLIELGLDPDGDPVDGMLKLLFAPPDGFTAEPQPHQPEPVA